MSTLDKIKYVETQNLKKGIPDFKIGDTVSVHVKIIEEGKARTQIFEGIVISKNGSGSRAVLTVRKISFGEGVERIFPINSPFVEKIAILKRGDIKRAKLYYLRKKVGKATRVDEKIAVNSDAAAPASGPAAVASEPAAAVTPAEQDKKAAA